ncbi:MAG TPA: hypothetical protein VFV95_17275 [Vicinamibacterales bacterium]|nr:hypothetical protein [Vicinamibacterales bacterium]
MLIELILVPALLATPTVSWDFEGQALKQFSSAISAYTHTHRSAVQQLAPALPCRGPEAITMRRDELAGNIRAARPDAHEGDIFTPSVAFVLRKRLRDAIPRLMPMPADEAWQPAEQNEGSPLAVNEFLPWQHGTHPYEPLLSVLPALPEELEYRLSGSDLVLLDVDARIVVDILREAVP